MRVQLVTGVAISLVALGGTAAYATHASSESAAVRVRCAPVKASVTAAHLLVSKDLKRYAQLSAASPSGAGAAQAAFTRDQDDRDLLQIVATHPDCFPSADVTSARRWVVLQQAQMDNDAKRLSK